MSERRPIAARRFAIFQRMARGLAKAGVSANAVSVAGLCFGVLSGVALAATALVSSDGAERLLWFSAAALIQLRLLMNMLDGMVAIESGQASAIGELYNEAPDRLSDTTTLAGLGCAAGGAVALGLIAACLAIFVAYIRALGSAAGAPAQFCGPMAKQQRMFLVTLTAAFMAAAPAAWTERSSIDAPAIPAHWGWPAWALCIIILGCIITAGRRWRRITAALMRQE